MVHTLARPFLQCSSCIFTHIHSDMSFRFKSSCILNKHILLFHTYVSNTWNFCAIHLCLHLAFFTLNILFWTDFCVITYISSSSFTSWKVFHSKIVIVYRHWWCLHICVLVNTTINELFVHLSLGSSVGVSVGF